MGNHRKPSDGDDVVEIISIGRLYTGPWHKKYWTSSRGKGRHPYPLDYCAVRVRSGHTYRMEVQEGRNGPLFVVSCEDGVSGSGPTPSRAWENHQRKSSSPVVSNGCGKRLSGNIDGNELFGFRNPSVQRLFRELVLEHNGMAEKSLLSSPVDNVVCQLENGNQTRAIYTSCCSLPLGVQSLFDVSDGLHAEEPNFPSSFVEVQDTRCKMAESTEHENSLLLDEYKLDGLSNPELDEQLPKRTNDEDRKMVTSCTALEMYISDTLGCTQGSRECLSVKQEGTMAVEPSETFSCPRDIISTNICEAFPRKSDLHDRKSFDIPSEEKLSPLVPARDIAEGLEESQPELCAFSTSVACSRTNRDCAEQEAAKSMMMLLLPRALPLLKTYKRRKNHVKKTNFVSSFCQDGFNDEDKDADLVSNSANVSAKGGNVTENLPTKRFKQNNVGKMHDIKTVSTTVTLGGLCEYEKSAAYCMNNESDTGQQNVIYANSVIPDSFDDEHRSLLSPNKGANSSCNNVMMGLGSSKTPGLDMVPVLESKICEDITENNMDSPASKFCRKNVMDCTYSKVAKGNKSKVSVELKGCYIHPDPILSIFLIPKEDELQICVLSGCLKNIDRNVFIYKVDLQKQRAEFPFFLGYTPLTFPVTEYPSRSIQLERSGLQFTPDGRFLILHNSIGVPFCRKQNVNCLCSACEALCFAENGIRIVRVEFGYASIVTTLRTDKRVSYILVCGSHLVAAEENGELHAWKMESDWSAGLVEFFLPGFYNVSHPILDLNKIPSSDSLIIGHNGIGDFGLWDISKRSLIARFSSPGNLVFQVVPLSLFSWGENVGTDNLKIEEHVNDPDHEWTKGDIAVWLLVSASSDFEDSYYHLVEEPYSNPFGSWRLALLAKETFIMGPLLDARSSAVESSFGHGILGTTDGLLCWWDLSTGEKLGSIDSCQGEGISCIAADEKSGTLVVASDTSRLFVYGQSCGKCRC